MPTYSLWREILETLLYQWNEYRSALVTVSYAGLNNLTVPHHAKAFSDFEGITRLGWEWTGATPKHSDFNYLDLIWTDGIFQSPEATPNSTELKSNGWFIFVFFDYWLASAIKNYAAVN